MTIESPSVVSMIRPLSRGVRPRLRGADLLAMLACEADVLKHRSRVGSHKIPFPNTTRSVSRRPCTRAQKVRREPEGCRLASARSPSADTTRRGSSSKTLDPQQLMGFAGCKKQANGRQRKAGK